MCVCVCLYERERETERERERETERERERERDCFNHSRKSAACPEFPIFFRLSLNYFPELLPSTNNLGPPQIWGIGQLGVLQKWTNFIQKFKGTRIAKTILKKKSKAGRLECLHF